MIVQLVVLLAAVIAVILTVLASGIDYTLKVFFLVLLGGIAIGIVVYIVNRLWPFIRVLLRNLCRPNNRQ